MATKFKTWKTIITGIHRDGDALLHTLKAANLYTDSLPTDVVNDIKLLKKLRKVNLVNIPLSEIKKIGEPVHKTACLFAKQNNLKLCTPEIALALAWQLELEMSSQAIFFETIMKPFRQKETGSLVTIMLWHWGKNKHKSVTTHVFEKNRHFHRKNTIFIFVK